MGGFDEGKHSKTIMAFGAHPDDVEIGMGGTMAVLSQQGYHTIIVDLTAGEMGSNGSRTMRLAEAAHAADVLRISERINLHLRDRGIRSDETAIELVTRCIRDKRPTYIFLPYRDDRHPDHRNAYHLIDEAIMNAGLIRFCPDAAPHRVQERFEYFINEIHEPSRFWDISTVTDLKYDALAAYRSQFKQSPESIPTSLNQGFIERIRTRDAYWGGICGTGHAEMFRAEKPASLRL